MQRVLIALLTVIVFAAGFGARVLTENSEAIPAPPTAGEQFVPKSSDPAPRGRGGPGGPTRTQVIATIDQYGKQIDSYRTRLDELDKEFEKGFLPLLTPEQMAIYRQDQDRRNDMIARFKAQADSKLVLTDDQMDQMRNNPLSNVLRMLQPNERTKRLADNYKLDPAQVAATTALMDARRDKFVKLLDDTPNMSVRYSDLAPMVARIADPAILEREKQEKAERDRKKQDTDKK